MLMIALRGHYVIDLISGVIFAHYFFMLAERLSYLIDVKLFRMPFYKRFPSVAQACHNCQVPLDTWCDYKYDYKLVQEMLKQKK